MQHAVRSSLTRPLRRLAAHRSAAMHVARASSSLSRSKRVASESESNSRSGVAIRLGLGLGLGGVFALGTLGSSTAAEPASSADGDLYEALVGKTEEESFYADDKDDSTAVLGLTKRLKAKLGNRIMSGGQDPAIEVYALSSSASAVEFALPASISVLEPFALLSQRLEAAHGPLSVRPIHTTVKEPCGFALHFEDGTGGLRMKKPPGNKAAKLVFFANNVCSGEDGFTDADLDAVRDAYLLTTVHCGIISGELPLPREFRGYNRGSIRA